MGAANHCVPCGYYTAIMQRDTQPVPIYLDYAASAPLRPEAREAMLAASGAEYGNPSSTHRWGRAARALLEDARARLAAVIGAQPDEIVFMRGGTEADNLAIFGRAAPDSAAGVVCTSVEHKAVLGPAHALAEAGHPVRVLDVDVRGVVDLNALRGAAAEGPAVVSVIWANNETGVVQPIEQIANICAQSGVVFHSDAVQALGRLAVRMDLAGVDLLSITAHKVGGPRGTGALFVKRGTELAPRLHGGGQERGLRPGTEDVAGAVGFAAAAELAEAEREQEMARLGALRDRLEASLLSRVPELVVNGAGADRLATHSSVVVRGVAGEMLMAALDLAGIGVSAGSACSSGALTISHVLRAMGGDAVVGPSIRFSLGRGTTEEEIDFVISSLPPLIAGLRDAA